MKSKKPNYGISIHMRMTISFSIIIILFSVVLLTISIMVFSNSFLKQENQLVQDQMSLLLEDMESNITRVRATAQHAVDDMQIKSFLESGRSDYAKIEQNLYNYATYTNGIQRVIVVTKDKKVEDSFYSASPSTSAAFLQLSGVDKFIGSGREELFSAPNNLPLLTKSNLLAQNDSISYVKTLRDDDYRYLGCVVLTNSRRYLFASRSGYDTDVFDALYVIDRSGAIVYHEGVGEDGSADEHTAVDFALNKNYENSAAHPSGDSLLYKRTLKSYPEWTVVGCVSQRSLKQGMGIIYTWIITVGLIGIVMVLWVSNYISKQITFPISQMKKAMASFQSGEMPEPIESMSKDELGYLVAGFNGMLEDISQFGEEIYHEQEEKKKAEVAALKFQIESLQSQINPHFLYNTLNTVSYLAMENRTSEIREMIQNLNILLRSTLSDQDEFIPIWKEVNFLEAYVCIQNYRYEDIVQLKCTVPEELKSFFIPKLILQPLVENALIHGIYPTGHKGTIAVTIQSEEDTLMISVSDDGVGFQLQPGELPVESGKGFNRIGVKNVNDRLLLYYGKMSGLHYDSTPGKGTEVSFFIPKQKEC